MSRSGSCQCAGSAGALSPLDWSSAITGGARRPPETVAEKRRRESNAVGAPCAVRSPGRRPSVPPFVRVGGADLNAREWPVEVGRGPHLAHDEQDELREPRTRDPRILQDLASDAARGRARAAVFRAPSRSGPERSERPAPGMLSSDLGWEIGEYCYYDPAWSDRSRWIINKAMVQINAHLDFIQYFFDHKYETKSGGKIDPACLINLLSARGTGGYLHFQRGDAFTELCGGGTGWSGCTMYGAVVQKLDKHIVWACYNSHERSAHCGSDTWSRDTGECACIVSYLASVIVHETAHSCFLGETPALLLGNYYLARYENYWGFDDQHCCGVHGRSYREADYASDAEACNGLLGLALRFADDGHWYVDIQCAEADCSDYDG